MISIYLAGKIQKAHETPNESYWGPRELAALKAVLGEEVLLLNPSIRSDDLSDQKSVFGRDMVMVSCADAVFVDARERRGLGVGAEMMWAKVNRIPIVTLAPRGSHYHKGRTSLLDVEVANWVHPFVENLSDKLVDTVEEGAAWLLERPDTIKGPEAIHEAMAYYRATQFENDLPMQEHVAAYPTLLSPLSP
ncbi:MAG: hypothetical protein AB7F31_06580 [Parachlamydiales bacterium]